MAYDLWQFNNPHRFVFDLTGELLPHLYPLSNTYFPSLPFTELLEIPKNVGILRKFYEYNVLGRLENRYLEGKEKELLKE